jgi:HEAT repeat protein
MRAHAPWPGRRPTGRWFAALILIGLALLPTHAALQQARTAQNLVPVSEETALIAQGWAALGAGDAVTASDRAQLVLGKYPQSVGALALAVEAAIARNGAMSGLTAYESWLGARKLEDPFVVRRIAIAALRETMNTSNVADGRARYVAMKALAAEGDAQALSKLAEGIAKSLFMETRAMAELGDVRAVQTLLKRLESAPPGGKGQFIEALAATKSKLAVPAMVKLLDDPDPFVVAAAADALGKLDARETIARLRPLVEEGHPGPQRWAAARALALMGDGAGTPFLRQMLVFTPDGHAAGADDAGDMLQIQAAEGLAPLGPNPDWINTARRLAGSPNPQVRMLAAKVIAPQDQSLAKDTLEGLLRDSNSGIREMATEILASRVAGDFVTLRGLVRSPDAYARTLAAARIVELTR